LPTNTLTPTFTPSPTPITYRITGFVFNDLNNNGSHDSGEPGIASVRIVLGGTTKQAYTNSDGYYIISGLPDNSQANIGINYPNGFTSNQANPYPIQVRGSDATLSWPLIPIVTPTSIPTNTPSLTPTSATTIMPEDIDRDGCVGILDFNAWLSAYQNNVIMQAISNLAPPLLMTVPNSSKKTQLMNITLNHRRTT